MRDGAASQRCNGQRTACKMGHATDKRQHANRGRALCNSRLATQHMQRDEMRRGTGDRQRTPCDMGTLGRAADNRPHATENERQAIDSRPQTTCSKHGPTDSVPHRAKDSNQQATHPTDTVQQTADDMQEDASTCEMPQETHGPAAFRVRRAAGSAQPAACAKHWSRQPVRNTAQAPHTRCNIRPVPQHAANTHEADNTQQAM